VKKDILILFIICAVAALVAVNTDIKTPEEYYADHPDAVTEDSEYVTLVIDAGDILQNGYDCEELSDDGFVLPETKFVLRENDTAFDVLKRAAGAEGITLDYSDSFGMVYVKGIDGIYEFGYGEASGWNYLVNGKSPDTDCGGYMLKSGDNVVFRYTCDYRSPLKTSAAHLRQIFTPSFCSSNLEIRQYSCGLPNKNPVQIFAAPARHRFLKVTYGGGVQQ